MFAWLINHQPAVLFSQNKPATSNQPAVFFSQNKSAPDISHEPYEQVVYAGTYRKALVKVKHVSSGQAALTHYGTSSYCRVSSKPAWVSSYHKKTVYCVHIIGPI
jgi:hypothetical protein